MKLRRIAAIISLTTLVVSAAFGFKVIRVANPIKIEIDHSDFHIESTYIPRSMRFHLSIYGFKYVEQRERKSPDLEDLGLVKSEDPYRTTLKIVEEGQDFSQPTELNAIAFRAISQKFMEIVLSMEPLEANDFGAECKSSYNIEKSSACHASVTPHGEEVSFCPVSKGVLLLEITYLDSSSTKHSRIFPRVRCFRVLTDGPLNISANDGFGTKDPFEIHVQSDVQSETPFITDSTPEPILVNQIPLDLKKRLVHDLKVRAGKDWDEERSYLSWSLRTIPGTSRKYHFSASSPNTSFLAANDEQVLKAEINQDVQNHIPAIAIQDIRSQIQAGSFSIYDRLQSSDLSEVTISSKDLNGVAKVKFRTGLLVPAVRDFLKQKEPLYRRELLLRLCERMLTFVKDKKPSDKEIRKIEPEQLIEPLFSKRSRRNRYKDESTDAFWEIQTAEFEPYIQRAAKNEKDSQISEALIEMLSSLRQQGDTSYEIPSIAADEKYPVLMGLEFPDKIDDRPYHGKVTIKGKNFDEVEVPVDFEVYDPWTKRWSAIWEFGRILLSAIAGGLVGLWLSSKKDRKDAAAQELSKEEIKIAAPVIPTAIHPGSAPEIAKTELMVGTPSADRK